MKRNTQMANKHPGVGLDIGTMNFVSARIDPSTGKPAFKKITDAYIELEVENVKTLKLSNISYDEVDDVLVVTGEKSFQMANLFKQEVQRPLSKGLISPGALKAQKILNNLVFSVLDVNYDSEHCFYSVPSNPVDLPEQDVDFHRELFRRIITQHGYVAHPTNEALAIIYSECTDTNFSGLAMSFGAGLCNVALAYNTVMGLNFSIAKGGGDWVDSHAATATGSSAARMCMLKERGGFDLSKASHESPETDAIALYVRTLIQNCLKSLSDKLRKDKSDHSLLDNIPLIVSGGTSLAQGFMDVFNEEFENIKKTKGFPISISEVRQAKDPLNAVASGLLVLARNEHS
jgi:hypothetical protein